jgi:Flp pilus assembly protein TadD
MLQAPPGEISAADFLTGAASFYWLLSAEQQRQLRSLGPEAFGNRVEWAFAQCRLARWQGDGTAARAFADSLRVATEELLRSPSDFQLTWMHAAALAWLGRQREAEALARQLREHPGPGPQPENTDLAVMYTDIGRVDSAAKYFTAAIGNREQPGVIGMIPYAPQYAALRAYQPFQPYLRQLAAFGHPVAQPAP